MQQILLVKTSSLGDVVHNLPVVSDIRRAFPDACIDWVVEEAFADIPGMHPALREVIPLALRRWRKQWNAANCAEFRAFRQHLRARRYDLVLDSQGLVKSAAVSLLARGQRVGHAWGSAREALASLAYAQRIAVPQTLHAVVRNRELAATALGYAALGLPDYGLQVADWSQLARLNFMVPFCAVI